MDKILAVARAEYSQAVRSKAFIIGLLAMPLLMGGSIAAQVLLRDQTDLTDRKFAVYDPTGELYEVIAQAVDERNAGAIWSQEEGEERKQERPRFLIEKFEPTGDERPDIALSSKVSDKKIFGFLLIQPEVVDVDEIVNGDAARGTSSELAYHTENPTFTELPNWLEGVVNGEVRRRRFEAANLDQELVSRLDRRVQVTTYGLASARSDGTVEEAEKEHEGRTFGVPAASMFLLFMLIFTSAPALMNQVLEEKMQRISEVLVSAVTPFQLMMGKLVGSVFVSMTLALLYLGGVFWATHHYGIAHFVPPLLYLWIPLLLILALLMYGSIFSALGSACSELRDAQSMMMPAMILVMIPLFAWTAVIESPNGTVARVLTFFPTATPLILVLRVAAPPGPPVWEVVAALVVCIAATVVMVAAAGKIFRVGVLSQGQTPSFRNLLGWLLSK